MAQAACELHASALLAVLGGSIDPTEFSCDSLAVLRKILNPLDSSTWCICVVGRRTWRANRDRVPVSSIRNIVGWHNDGICVHDADDRGQTAAP